MTSSVNQQSPMEYESASPGHKEAGEQNLGKITESTQLVSF